MLLVMGFTGKRAMGIKIAYINAFNRMTDTGNEIAGNIYQQRIAEISAVPA